MSETRRRQFLFSLPGAPAAARLKTVLFPDAFSAHRIRLVPHQDCTATVSFFFT